MPDNNSKNITLQDIDVHTSTLDPVSSGDLENQAGLTISDIDSMLSLHLNTLDSEDSFDEKLSTQKTTSVSQRTSYHGSA